MKKNVLAAGIVLCLAAIAAICIFVPAPIIKDPDDAEIYLVRVVNPEYDYDDITEQIDCDQLVQIIAGYTRSRLPHNITPYQMTVGDIEMSGIVEGKSMHFCLGSVDVVYGSTDKGGYTIHDGEQIDCDVRALMP
jgi:hypothetical protein